MTRAIDIQIGGDHYKSMQIQPIEFIIANGLGFCEGSAIKYICRYKRKGGIEDLKKAKHYIDMLIEQEGKKDDVCIQRKDEEDRPELDRWVKRWNGVWEGVVPVEYRDLPPHILR
jgi:Protein of unknwon function (DUF3310)